MATAGTPPYEAACINDLNLAILERRYLAKDKNGKVLETPEDMFWRVATHVAEAETRYGASKEEVENFALEFYRLMSNGLFEPNTPTLINAGRNNKLSLSACFVLPISDSLVNGKDSIYQTLSNMAAIHQSGGGTGFSFSNLRPEGSIVNSTSGVASGPVSFMSLYDSSTDVVKQGGTRRGANMGILRVDHPDIMEFIRCKSDVHKITNFNISVAVTDAFVQAVKEDLPFNLTDPKTGKAVKRLRAREIYDSIVEQAHATGEPGLFFIDEANRSNPVPHLGSYEATNPCGEQPLLPYDVCNLGSINLGAYANKSTSELVKDIEIAVRFLDNVIDVNNYPLNEIRKLSDNIRRIGLGIMGWADYLLRKGIPYTSPEAIEEGRKMMQLIQDTAHTASEKLAKTKGTFPEWEASVWGPDDTCAKTEKGERIRPERKLRNCNITTVAPTGSISIIAGCSGGIEPLFAVAFIRNQAGLRLPDINKDFERIAKAEGWYNDDLFQRIAEDGSIDLPEVPDKWKEVFVTAHDVAPEQHVRMQAAFQEHCDSAISKTINLPHDATVEDVKQTYDLAYELQCKGITVYRDGSRPGQVLSTGKTDKKTETEKSDKPKQTTRPEYTHGFTRKLQFATLGKVYITVNFEEDTGKPIETFLHLGKAGSDENSFTEALGRMISLYLKDGGDIRNVIRQLENIGGKTFAFHNGKTYSSIPDAIGDTLRTAIKEPQSDRNQLTIFGSTCPECGAQLQLAEGCMKCLNCGYSACG